ncbi:hypothetical protein [Pedobacter sp. GR22-10]|uniref:hypothetical protein n=1 Tax=Pedobacter sp. GR22-10 TaxID=2994472 RepID=UPI002245FF4F|nr:hypothetical protein [Pedobacter sp. GR22-10]MCX2429912.1 hypothetical protein [Pedobacter sp. GR22-10]
MLNILKEKLKAYILINNPELLIRQEGDLITSTYLEVKVSQVMPLVLRLLSEDKPAYIIEELALNEMTAVLKPSRYNYLLELLETEFQQDFEKFREIGVLRYEVLNLMECCSETFEVFDFSEANEGNRFLRYAVIGKVHEYLN